MGRATEGPSQPPHFRFCPHCGQSLSLDPDEGRPRCPGCGFIHYLNPIAVVAGILLSDSSRLPPADSIISPSQATHILLVRRRGTYIGQWCIPCGYLEYDEEIRTAAVREMREESGLDVEVCDLFTVLSNFHRPDEQTVGVWFLTRYLGGVLVPGDDADRAVFYPLDDVPAILAFPTDRRVIELLRGRRARTL